MAAGVISHGSANKKTDTSIQQANSSRAAAKQFKAECPDAYRDIGNLGVGVAFVVVAKLTGDESLMANMAIHEHLEEMRTELAGEDPTRLERLLADQIAVCWLHLHWLEMRLLNTDDRGLCESLEQRISGAQRRYLAVIKTLEQVRALMRPAINVQRMAIIGKQVLAVNGHEQAALSAG